MKKLIVSAICAVLIMVFSGCANCSLKNLFRGAPCNSCNPTLGKPPVNFLSNCNNGTCGTPDMAAPAGNCATGNCGNATLGAPAFGSNGGPAINAPNVQPPIFGQPNGVPYYSNPNLNSAPVMGPSTFNNGQPAAGNFSRTGSTENTILPPSFGG